MESHAVIIDQNDRLADFTRDWRILLLAGMAVIVGCISAVVAYLLVQLIALITNLAFYFRFSTAESLPTPDGWKLGVVLIPMLGGLIIGLMAYYGSEKIRGHGIPEALEAILIGRSKLQLKVAILKPLSSAISIGTGGPFGAEGPIIMTGGAFGSLFAQLFSLSATERKILLVAGAAGGMAAIFATPVAAVILAVELLLFEWRPRSFIPVTIAASVAAVLRVPLLGSGPIFFVTPHSILAYATFFWALVIGLVAGIVAAVVTGLVYAFEDLFHRLPIHWMWWPAIGGFCVGIGGLLDPRVMGVGYDTIHTLLRGELTGVTLWSLLIIKALVWSIALGSGTSGGVLAPLLIIGGAVGALEAGF
ncbi:MAG: chloride channel protein, partial [Caldilineaceae bacterium]|nr:chloride channel protein [Caldilineaceae bacterium]